MKKRWPTYNDGVLDLYKVRDDTGSSFGAKKNVGSLSDMTYFARASFAISAKRQQDVEFAESLGFALTLKLKTMRIPGIAGIADFTANRSEFKAVISGYLYNVKYFDTSSTEMFLYLEGVKEIGE